MERIRTTMLRTLPALVLTATLVSLAMGAVAQEQSKPPQQEQQKSETRTFTGKIVKAGDMLVLAAPTEKKTYQLDDQEKAQEFINKNVKVTGILDMASGIIRVSAIEPA
ncbi:MAG: hypothetical protein LAP21_05535 [Acidobacteriia bacterium]|nr:hypothetical protein [Terriglobia bacterium]